MMTRGCDRLGRCGGRDGPQRLTGVIAAIYGVIYYINVRDTPKGSTYFKPKKSGGLEVSNWGDFWFLLAMNIPMYVALAVLTWKLSPSNLGLLTDNAWAYRYSLREVCATRGISQRFIQPRCPWQNGKVERFNRTLQVEWAYRRVYLTNDARTAALDPWLEDYNTRRHHSAIGDRPPISRLAPTS